MTRLQTCTIKHYHNYIVRNWTVNSLHIKSVSSSPSHSQSGLVKKTSKGACGGINDAPIELQGLPSVTCIYVASHMRSPDGVCFYGYRVLVAAVQCVQFTFHRSIAATSVSTGGPIWPVLNGCGHYTVRWEDECANHQGCRTPCQAPISHPHASDTETMVLLVGTVSPGHSHTPWRHIAFITKVGSQQFTSCFHCGGMWRHGTQAAAFSLGAAWL